MRDGCGYGKPESNLETNARKGRRSLAADEPDAAKPEPGFQAANHANKSLELILFIRVNRAEGIRGQKTSVVPD
jgi:hypothetical protein